VAGGTSTDARGMGNITGQPLNIEKLIGTIAGTETVNLPMIETQCALQRGSQVIVSVTVVVPTTKVRTIKERAVDVL
jgi:hypothetical protein